VKVKSAGKYFSVEIYQGKHFPALGLEPATFGMVVEQAGAN
jgi:hypothetical protein